MKDRATLLARLYAHQESALTLMRDAESMLRDSAGRDVAALSRLRWSLMRAMTEYQLFKHNQIFDPAIAATVLGTAARAERVKRACIAMGAEFRAYVTKWSGTDVAGAWPTYQPAALKMIARLRDHIRRERAECEALLDAAA